MMTRRILAAALLAASVIGCGDSGPRRVPVSGTVSLNGKPLEGAIISFLPVPENKEGMPAEDITGPSGNYKAMTKGRSGVVPGKYRVSITKSLVDPAKVDPSFKDDPFMAQLSTSAPEAGKGKKGEAAPDKIEWAEDREVTTEGGELDFDVKSAVK
jgi:hypothetical protein